MDSQTGITAELQDIISYSKKAIARLQQSAEKAEARDDPEAYARAQSLIKIHRDRIDTAMERCPA